MTFSPTLFIVFVIVLLQTCFGVIDIRESKTNVFESVNGFALEMYRKLKETPGNIFFSPFSIYSALAMTSLGAKENTLSEMLKTLKMENYDKDVVHLWFKDFRHRLLSEKAQKEYTLSVANRLFGEKSYRFLDSFLQDTSEYYSSQLEAMNFKTKIEASRIHINNWVSSVTNDKIKEILAPDVLDAMTRLVLVNAVYFKGDWLEKFSAKETEESYFYVTRRERIRVPMMHKKSDVSYGYSETLKSQMLELPYKGDNLSMVIILPELKFTTLTHLEQSITPSTLLSFSRYQVKVDLWLPKFKLESSFDLKEQLEQMGMKDLFMAGRADLSGMNGSRGLYVSKVVHKAFVEVNEEGSEAAASTIGILTPYGSSTRENEFKVNHPFLFYIRDNKSKSILFLGRVIKP